MKKTILILPIIVFSYTVSAQKKYSLLLKPMIGYETNILRSPYDLVTESDTVEAREAWKNAPFIGMKMNLIYTRKNSDLVKIRALAKKSLLTNRQRFSAHDFRLRTAYIHHFKVHSNKTEVELRSFSRHGNGDFQSIGGAPLSYNLCRITNELDLALSKPWHLVFLPTMSQKSYTRSKYDHFGYFNYGLKISGNYRYSYKRKTGFSVYGKFDQRRYRLISIEEDSVFEELGDDEFMDTELLETEKNRTWNYMKVGADLKIPLKGNKLILKYGFSKKVDASQNRFGYNQFNTELTYVHLMKKSKLELSCEYLFRQYDQFSVTLENDNFLLRYQYFIPKIRWTKPLSTSVNLFIALAGKHRYSNGNSSERTQYRSYTQSNFNIGITIRPHKKKPR